MSPAGGQETAIYQVKAKGQLEPRWARAFEDLQLERAGDGVLTWTGAVVDQSALYGLLKRICSAGLTLFSIRRILAEEKR
jgi:hypothetical protein